MSRIFISYRREDSAPYAGRLYDLLESHFGRDNVFMDIDTIQPGDDFVEAIERAIGSCDAVVAVIGKGWTSVTDGAGRPRLHNPQDFVRLEVETALSRNIRLVPVLVGGADVPRAAELPQEIQALVRRNALELSDTRFRDDVNRLIQALERTLEQSAPLPNRDAPPAPSGAPAAASPQWRAELLAKTWWRRSLRVHLSHESHTVEFENTWDVENVRVDGVIVAQGGSLTTWQEEFTFQVPDGPLRYEASIEVKPNLWLSNISAFRLSIHGRLLYQEGNRQA